MKQFILLFLLLLSISGIQANLSDKKISIVIGTAKLTQNEVTGANPNTIMLFHVTNGTKGLITSSQILEDGRFTLSFFVEKEGFYVLGNSYSSSANDHLFYFKPGDILNIAINETSYKLTGENTPENRELEQWQAFLAPVKQYTNHLKNTTIRNNPADFFTLLNNKVSALKDYKQSYTKNKVFNEAFHSLQSLDMYHHALLYVLTPPAITYPSEQLPDFYQQIKLSNVTKKYDFLSCPYGMDLLTQLHDFQTYMGNPIPENIDEYYQYNIENIKNKDLLGEWIFLYSVTNKELKSYESLSDIKKKYGHLLNVSQQERLKQVLMLRTRNVNGQSFLDFTLKDSNGKSVSFSDFSGKIIYIDIWATWCIPCLKEIPSLKELEKKYEGKDIVFLSISIDSNKDIEKWKKFIVEKELGGVQLFAGDQTNDLSIAYQIMGIPRFMLFGKDGTILATNAPQPSNPKTTEILDKLLSDPALAKENIYRNVVEALDKTLAQKDTSFLNPHLSETFAISTFSGFYADARTFLDLIVKHEEASQHVEYVSDTIDTEGRTMLKVLFHERGQKISSLIGLNQENKIEFVDYFDLPFGQSRFAESTLVTTIPFEWSSDAKMKIYLKINDNPRPLPFMFDSGATGININKATADTLGLVINDTGVMHMATGIVETDLSEGNTIQVGDVILNNQTIAVVNHQSSSDVIGIIGLSIIRKYITKIDFRNRQITLYTFGNYMFEPEGSTVAMTMPENLIYIPATINMAGDKEVPGNFTLDTGAASHFVAFAPFVKKHQLLAGTGNQTQIKTFGVSSPMQLRRAHELKINDTIFEKNITTMLQESQQGDTAPIIGDGSIGISFLKKYDITIDMLRRKVHFNGKLKVEK